jgi:hypothetical protein
MNDVSEQQMAERVAPQAGPGREAAEADARRMLQSAREQAKQAEYNAYAERGTQSALAALATTWLHARHSCLLPSDLTGSDAAELLTLARIAERMGHCLAATAVSQA